MSHFLVFALLKSIVASNDDKLGIHATLATSLSCISAAFFYRTIQWHRTPFVLPARLAPAVQVGVRSADRPYFP